jgi:hypothetical protein
MSDRTKNNVFINMGAELLGNEVGPHERAPDNGSTASLKKVTSVWILNLSEG